MTPKSGEFQRRYVVLHLFSYYLTDMVETIGEAFSLEWQFKARCAFGNRDGMKSVRQCVWRGEWMRYRDRGIRHQQRSSALFRAPGLVIGALAIGAAGGSTVFDFATGNYDAIGAGCDIKGNISIDTGERIFHVPGQEYYSRTQIRPQYGERWFCSEAEAREAGWRKARR